MKSLELPCDTNPRDRLTLARVGGCAAVTTPTQVNLTPADARRAAAWLLEFAGEVEASLAQLRAKEEAPKRCGQCREEFEGAGRFCSGACHFAWGGGA